MHCMPSKNVVSDTFITYALHMHHNIFGVLFLILQAMFCKRLHLMHGSTDEAMMSLF